MEEYEKIFYSILKKMGLYNKKDDYIDICWIGYARALKQYDDSKGKISTYVYKCVKNEILKELRHEGQSKRQGIIISLDKYHDETLPSFINLEKDIINSQTNELLFEALGRLTGDEYDIITNLYKLNGQNMTANELADKLGLTYNQVRTIKARALKKLRTEMGNEFEL